MPFTLSPTAVFTGFDDIGAIVPGGKLWTYAAGTATELATFIDSAGTSNTNPVVLNAAGRAVVYLGGFHYKFIFTDANDVGIWSAPDVYDSALTAVSGSIVGTTDTQTLTNKTLNSPTINFGTLNSVTLNTPVIGNPNVTTGTFTTPSIASPIFTTKIAFVKRVEWAKGANVVSAAALTLGDDGNVFAVTGGAVIDAITTTNWQGGSPLILIFTGVMTLNHNTGGPVGTAPMLLSGGTNFSTIDPTVVMFAFDGASWQEISRSINHF